MKYNLVQKYWKNQKISRNCVEDSKFGWFGSNWNLVWLISNKKQKRICNVNRIPAFGTSDARKDKTMKFSIGLYKIFVLRKGETYNVFSLIQILLNLGNVTMGLIQKMDSFQETYFFWLNRLLFNVMSYSFTAIVSFSIF